eukprot:Blabericola_migrator_1__11991@NODE_735_length_6690_cov_180_559112_g528_i0_p3_GENE_NODE_735_length_6690_cov_180_559112_g528_i0NODE_735_length_6690_cov_180_559112_g528_i0_p3_ORF_typecomplete_len199_score27_92DUF4220/PF13968_6/0_041TM_helix/PF05552_12/0_35_NODE_735_length_6690_cov_180_559112_g528_i0157753
MGDSHVSQVFQCRQGSGLVCTFEKESSLEFFSIMGSLLKAIMTLALMCILLDVWDNPKLQLISPYVHIVRHLVIEWTQIVIITFMFYWPSILSAAAVFLGALVFVKYANDTLLKRWLGRAKQSDLWDRSPPTIYPEGYTLVANRMSISEMERIKEECTRKELRDLFRSQEWRAHLRERGKDDSAYNWQKRRSEQQQTD